MNMQNKKWAIAGFLFSLVISVLWFQNGLPKATGESGLLFATIDRQFQIAQYSWADTTIGETPFSFNGAIPLFAVFRVLNTVLSGALIQALFFAVTILLGFFGAALIAREFYPKIGQGFLFFIGIAYVFNPYSIVFVWNRFLYNYTLAYGLVPFLLFLWIAFLRRGERKTLVLFAVSSFIGSFAFTGLSYFVCFGFSVLATSLVGFVLLPARGVTFKRIVTIGATFFFTQIFWLLPFYAGNRLGVGQSTSFFSEEGNLHTTLQLSQYYGGIIDKLSQIRADMPGLAYEGIPWAQWYTTSIVHAASFVTILMTVGSLVALIVLKARHKIVLGLSFGFLLLLSNGTSFPVGNLYLLLYKLHPVLAVLRNPYEKIGFLLYLVVFLVWGIGLWTVATRSSRFVGKILLSISFVWWIVNALPIFNGVVFTYKYEVSKDPKIGFSVSVPDYYREANSVVMNSNVESRLLALPMTGEGITHTWRYGYDGVESYNGLFHKASISLDTTTGQLPQISRYIRNSSASSVLASLPLLNVSDIMVRHDLLPPLNTATPQDLSRSYRNALGQNPSHTFGSTNLELFQIPEEYQSPRLFLTTKVASQNRAQFDPLNTPRGGATILSENSDVDIIYPDASFSEVASTNESTYSENQLLQLPHVSVQRGKTLYPLISLKEWFWKLTHGYELKAIYSTLSFKRLAEIEPLIGANNSALFEDAIADYLQANEPLVNEAQLQLLQSGSNRSFWELVFKSQESAMDKFIAKASGKERDTLVSMKENFVRKVTEVNVYPEYKNKIPEDIEYLLSRTIFSTKEAGEYQLNIDTSLANQYLGSSLQLNDNLLAFGKKNVNTQSLQVPVSLKKGKNEIRVPVQIKKQILKEEEFNLKSLETSQRLEAWDIDVPSGVGELVISFNYKIVRGQGPSLKIFREENMTTPLLVEQYPTESYDFDWKEKAIAIPIRPDLKRVRIEFAAKPSNDCEKNNPLDMRCSLTSFKEVYDRHSDFVLKNVVVTLKPEVRVHLTKKSIVQADSQAQISWQKINPALYRIDVTGPLNNETLVFLSQFHTGWSLYKDSQASSSNEVIKNWTRYRSQEGRGTSSFVEALKMQLQTFFMKPVSSDENHFVVNGYANGWTLQDSGSYILVFRPQQLLSIGWILTTLAGVGFPIFLFKYYGNKKKSKKGRK